MDTKSKPSETTSIEQKIDKTLVRLNKIRTKNLSYIRFISFISVISCVLFFFFFGFHIVGILIPLIIIAVSLVYTEILFRHQAKAELLCTVSDYFGLTYHQTAAFTIDDIRHHNLFPTVNNNEKLEDGFSGKKGNIPIAFQEIMLFEEMTKGQKKLQKKQEEENVIYKRLAIRIGLKKALSGHTVVLPDSSLNTWFRTQFSEYKQTKLAAPAFENSFDIHTTDPVESHYIFNPAFTERFLALRDYMNGHFSSDDFRVSFKEDEILILIRYQGDLFETGGLYQPLKREHIEKPIHDITVILGIPERLKLHAYIGT